MQLFFNTEGFGNFFHWAMMAGEETRSSGGKESNPQKAGWKKKLK